MLNNIFRIVWINFSTKQFFVLLVHTLCVCLCVCVCVCMRVRMCMWASVYVNILMYTSSEYVEYVYHVMGGKAIATYP